MDNKQIIIVLIVLNNLFSISYCQQNNLRGFTITGHIEGIENNTEILLYDINQEINLDSSYSKNGNFFFKGRVNFPTSCWIKCKNEYAELMVENIPMTFEGNIKDLYIHHKTKGGREQDLNNELNELQLPFAICYYRSNDSLKNVPDLNVTERDRLRKEQIEFTKRAMQILREFAMKHANSYIGLEYLYRTRNEIEKTQLKTIYEGLDSLMKITPYAKALKVYLYNEVAEKGKPFIDFEAQTLEGKPFRLSSLKGNYIFLSFWSAGCGPCRSENKKIKSNYDQLQKQMSIVSFSIDKNKSNWISASKKDSIIWYNISDLEGDNGKIKTLYEVQSIPTSFIINKEGIILDKINGYSDRIFYRINNILNKDKNER
jgi:peroxiredoxin